MNEENFDFDLSDDFFSCISIINKTKLVLSNRNDMSEVAPEICDNLNDVICILEKIRNKFKSPLNKFLIGKKLTKEEFCFLSAKNIIKNDALKDAYLEFSHYFYEGGECVGYINPSESPGYHLKIGIVPEEVKIKYLSIRQIQYFKKNCPDLFKRFKKE